MSREARTLKCQGGGLNLDSLSESTLLPPHRSSLGSRYLYKTHFPDKPRPHKGTPASPM